MRMLTAAEANALLRYDLGYFAKLEDARAAYEAKAREIHGEFRYVAPPFVFNPIHAGMTGGMLSFGT